MRESFHLVLAVAGLGVFLLALVATPPRAPAAEGEHGRFLVQQYVESLYGGSNRAPRVSQRRQQLMRTVESLYTGQHAAQRSQKLLAATQSEIERALGHSEGGRQHSGEKLGRVQAQGVARHSQDAGLPTLTSDSIWSPGSPQNEGWSGGDFESGTEDNAGTGKIRGSQYAWWQRHLLPRRDFQETMARLQAAEPHYDAHGNEFVPSQHAPVSHRGPGFNRLNP